MLNDENLLQNYIILINITNFFCMYFYSTVTDLAKLRGWSTSLPL